MVYLDQSLMIGAKVEIRIAFSQEEAFDCNGIVIRCQKNLQDPDNPKESYAVALTFDGLEESKLSCIKETIEKILTQENNK